MSDEESSRRRPPRLTGAITMDDIARLANVSKPTVSRVLGGSSLVSAKTRDRVLAVAREHGYAVNRNAQKLRQARTNTVAVVLDFGSHRHGAIGDPFIFELLAGVSEALSVRDVDLLLSPSGLDSAAGFIDLYRSRGTDGFIVLGQGARDGMLRDLARKDVPMVVWGAVREDAGYCAVGSDNLAGGRLAGERFLAQGRRNWLFVGNVDHEEIRLRHDGLCAAAAGRDDIAIDQLPTGSMTFAATYQSVTDHLRAGAAPDAVFAFSDTAAMAVISAFREQGRVAPRDYSLVGYNNIPPSAHFNPAITTIEQETGVAGAILVEKLMQRIDGGRPRSVMLPTKIILRET
ncbi:LacI family DNA-binding transcriptional regulator [Sphingomonas sp.]|uniref:LacI family DNA-binding transcriptional regulator n=1 Tax=Sphingomonas sp. TaxID=28214 RepID=UPI002BCB4E92|nr:LacI family DNA-binding transcriptional regulator [Sphingomonas sp.]HWK34618.1 LacI family DNA-binding transcriptional regulator [Sphingomonas sp.]